MLKRLQASTDNLGTWNCCISTRRERITEKVTIDHRPHFIASQACAGDHGYLHRFGRFDLRRQGGRNKPAPLDLAHDRERIRQIAGGVKRTGWTLHAFDGRDADAIATLRVSYGQVRDWEFGSPCWLLEPLVQAVMIPSPLL